jgi:hypothetical protein
VSPSLPLIAYYLFPLLLDQKIDQLALLIQLLLQLSLPKRAIELNCPLVVFSHVKVPRTCRVLYMRFWAHQNEVQKVDCIDL